MLTKKKTLLIVLIAAAVLLAGGLAALLSWHFAPYGYAREVSDRERASRDLVVQTAEGWLGFNEKEGSHRQIIDLYNSHKPLAQGYEVQYDDNWCSTFVSAMAIRMGYTDIIPTECGCQRQIGLFEEMGCWQEDDAYIPLPGDYIYYALSNKDAENTAWSDHVGIVVGTWNDYIKVIEGNYNEAVSYRFIRIDDVKIRGYGLPNFASEE